MSQIPPDAELALAEIRAVGGDELVEAMRRAFAAFAAAQVQWLERQLQARAYDHVADAARALRVSAVQVGALAVARACERAELTGAGGDASAVEEAVDAIAREVALARDWLLP